MSRGQVTTSYRIDLGVLVELETMVRELTLAKHKSDPFKHKIDDPKSSYDPLLRESEVINAIRSWRERAG